MATDVRAGEARPKVNAYDQQIAEQLGRAEGRIRSLDVAVGLLLFLAGTFAYALVLGLLDVRFVLSSGTRQFTFLLYAAGSVAWLYHSVVRPLRRRVNPRYAARLLEGTVPNSRNGLLNWVDLHGEKLPAPVRAILRRQALSDLDEVDVERAVSSKPALRAGGVTAVLGVFFFLLFFVLGPRPFFSVLGRTFFPFAGSGGVATRTQVVVLRPEGGDATVTIGSPLTLVVEVRGYVPPPRDRLAPRILYRHSPDEPYLERYLTQDESGREWATTISPADLGSELLYKAAAGDHESPEYRVKVRAAPLLADFQATYHYQPYVAREDRVRYSRTLEDLAGTEVTLRVKANRALKDGKLEFEATGGGVDVALAERVQDDPHSAVFRLTLERSGKYRLRYTTTEGEVYLDPSAHEVVAVPDQPPRVLLTEPEALSSLPADGILQVAGEARDDIGVQGITLKLQVAGGQALQSKPYLSEEGIRLPSGGHPLVLDYRDFWDLSKAATEDGKPFELKEGMEVEYWLEARDACDFPPGHGPNVATSARHRVRLTASLRDQKKREEEKKKAEQRQKEHEARRQRERQKEDEQRQKQREEEKAQREEEQKRRQGDGGKKEDKGKEEKGGQQNEKDQQTGDKAEKMKEALAQREQGKGAGGKPEDQRGEGKDSGEKKPGEGKGEGKNGQEGKKPDEPKGQHGSAKPGGPDKERKDAGEPKGEGAGSPEDKKDAGKGKDAGKEGKPQDGTSPGEKKAEPEKGEGKGEGKSKGEGAGKEDAAQGKDGAGMGSTAGGESKPKPGGGKGGEEKAGQSKGGDTSGEGSSSREVDPKNAKREDVNALARDLRNLDERGRQEAARKLEQVRQQAKQEEVREAAGEELNKAVREGACPGCNKPGNGPGSNPGAAGEEKKGPEGGKEHTGAGKEGKGPTKGQGEGKGGGKDGTEDKTPGKGAPPSAAAAKGRGPSNGTPGGGSANPSRAGSGASEPGKATPPLHEKPREHRASVLQLEEFRKKVDKNILKDLKMSPEEFQAFLRDYAELARRQEAQGGATEKLPATRPGGGSLPSIGSGTPLKPTGTTRTDGLRNEGRPKPPPGYRDAYSDFLRRQAESR